jgi:hypothetical protein
MTENLIAKTVGARYLATSSHIGVWRTGTVGSKQEQAKQASVVLG